MALNIEAIEKRIVDAAQHVRRSSKDVCLIAVSKKQSIVAIKAAIDCGQIHFGENYAQELSLKRDAMTNSAVCWHFIGKLQRNKVSQIVGNVTLIHAVDSVALAQAIDKEAVKRGVVQDILLAINLADEVSKTGIAIDDADGLLDEINELQGIKCKGLMGMPPLANNAENNRKYFCRLRMLRDRLMSIHPSLTELSMGTSHDFEVAVEEGATLIRVGTSIFGARA